MKILGISGSIRQGSFNSSLLRAAAESLPERVAFELYTCESLPLYNQDLDGVEKPPAVARLLELVNCSDALLISTPEYNYSIPGVLKNALDWASRPAFNSVLKDRPTAILSASMSGLGGVRAQIHLKQILGATLTPLFPAADFLVSAAHEVFTEAGNLKAPELENRLKIYLQDFVAWVESR